MSDDTQPVDQLAVQLEMLRRWIDRRYDEACDKVARWSIGPAPEDWQ